MRWPTGSKSSANLRAGYLHIPEKSIRKSLGQISIGMHNRLIHGYDTVDLNLPWDTVMSDLPPPIAVLESLIGGQ